MKVIEKKQEGKKGVVVVVIGSKKFKRVSWTTAKDKGSVDKVEWRRDKTNNQVNQEKQEELEKNFKSKKADWLERPVIHSGFPIAKKSGDKMVVSWPAPVERNYQEREDIKNIDIAKLEKNLKKKLKENDSKLVAVKWVKDQTGWTLLMSKNFAESVIASEKVSKEKGAFSNWRLPDGMTLGKLEKTTKKLADGGRSKLTAVKWVVVTTGWGLRDSKRFSDYVFAKNNF